VAFCVSSSSSLSKRNLCSEHIIGHKTGHKTMQWSQDPRVGYQNNTRHLMSGATYGEVYKSFRWAALVDKGCCWSWRLFWQGIVKFIRVNKLLIVCCWDWHKDITRLLFVSIYMWATVWVTNSRQFDIWHMIKGKKPLLSTSQCHKALSVGFKMADCCWDHKMYKVLRKRKFCKTKPIKNNFSMSI